MRRALQKVAVVTRPHCAWPGIEYICSKGFTASGLASRETMDTGINAIEQRFTGKLRDKAEAELQELLLGRERGVDAHSEVDSLPKRDQMVRASDS